MPRSRLAEPITEEELRTLKFVNTCIRALACDSQKNESGIILTRLADGPYRATVAYYNTDLDLGYVLRPKNGKTRTEALLKLLTQVEMRGGEIFAQIRREELIQPIPDMNDETEDEDEDENEDEEADKDKNGDKKDKPEDEEDNSIIVVLPNSKAVAKPGKLPKITRQTHSNTKGAEEFEG
ncbi:hypothetical protein CC86DRAFT_385943 [Ophiobolus disseminans]|uniref:Uncharacterized protein n=1 Tax=Ophiobolus disseminans TaxID=1469910 RepID=A0A6A6ZMZ3_9PLEO|nr:hypothetical protein CC86DRAFT_385943 [Ophiobolus disseminans]